jgi:hypothetical protein
MTEFQQWHRDKFNGIETWDAANVTRANFTDRLKQFRRETKPKSDDVTGSWKTKIGFVDGKLKFVRIAFGSSMKLLDGVLTKQPVYALVKKICTDFNDGAPKALQTAFPQAPLFGFGWMTTQQGFVDGLLNGLAICFPIAFAVLWAATGNIVLAIYATVCIAGVVTSVLGFCKVGMGWDLGVAESVAGIIVIGFSVDYIVHMAHMYVEAAEVVGAQTRVGRFKYAAEKMGQTIVGGAITTAGSGAMMFACQMVFFFKMGTLVAMTITFSVLFSLGLFMSLCVLIGPEGHFGDTMYHAKRCMGWGTAAETSAPGGGGGGRGGGDKELTGIEIRGWKTRTNQGGDTTKKQEKEVKQDAVDVVVSL